MEKASHCRCSNCKKSEESLYKVEAYCAAPIKVQSQGFGSYTLTYDLNNKKTVQYLICDKCIEKDIKFNKILKYISSPFLFLFLLALPFGYTLENIFNVAVKSGVDSPALPIILLMAALIIAFILFRKKDRETQIKTTIDSIARRNLFKDLTSGMVAPELKGRNIRYKVWTEYTKNPQKNI